MFQDFLRLPEGYSCISHLPKEPYLMGWFFIMSYGEKFACSGLRKILKVFSFQKPKESFYIVLFITNT